MKTQLLTAESLAAADETFWSQIREVLPPDFYGPEERILDRVKRELAPHGHLYFSNPTTLTLLFMDAVQMHSSDVMGECRSDSDIAKLVRIIEDKKREIFGLEMDFLDALEENRLDAAETLLSAIVAKRRGADSRLRTEANNWFHVLATKKKDIAMFVRAWNDRPPEAAYVKSAFTDVLHNLIYGCLIKEFLVIPSSPHGISKAFEQGQVKFADEQIGLFLKGALTALAENLAAAEELTAEGFKSLVAKTIGEEHRLFVSVNPYVKSIRVIWKA